MFPGMGGRGGMSAKQLNQMMKQMGITVEEVDNVEEVIIRTATKEYVIPEAEVTIMTAQGTKTYQVVGEATIRPRGAAPPAGAAAATAAAAGPAAAKFSEEDVKLVAQQAGVSLEKARQALEECDGETAEAIVKLTE